MSDLVPKGDLLVANPAIHAGPFDRTILLVVDHDEDGALGVVLNRPAPTRIAHVLPEWASLACDPAVFFTGGPVSPESVIGIAQGNPPPDGADGEHGWTEGWAPFWNDLATIDLQREPFELGADIRALRVFSGYAGWSPGQLEDEMEHGLWLVVPGTPEDVFTDAPDLLWRSVLGRQPGTNAWLANFPPEPSLN